MLTVRLSTREARQALAASYRAASRLLPEAAEAASVLSDLCSWSSAHIDEVRRIIYECPMLPMPFIFKYLNSKYSSQILDLFPLTLSQPDYERRLKAFGHLTPDFWLTLNRRQALPLVLSCLYDLRNPDDLALRQGAAQAIERFILATCQLSKEGQEDQDPDGLMRLLPQIVYSQLRNQVGIWGS